MKKLILILFIIVASFSNAISCQTTPDSIPQKYVTLKNKEVEAVTAINKCLVYNDFNPLYDYLNSNIVMRMDMNGKITAGDITSTGAIYVLNEITCQLGIDFRTFKELPKIYSNYKLFEIKAHYTDNNMYCCHIVFYYNIQTCVIEAIVFE